ncbi:MAG: hypothetical protein F4145_14965 [Boseongicola sp. SB0675_bin_26]|nr:hypothetical protein [Boseongicola sp. SB0675_bin_26]
MALRYAAVNQSTEAEHDAALVAAPPGAVDVLEAGILVAQLATLETPLQRTRAPLDDLEATWNAPTATIHARQQFLRTLIADILAGADKAPARQCWSSTGEGRRHFRLQVPVTAMPNVSQLFAGVRPGGLQTQGVMFKQLFSNTFLVAGAGFEPATFRSLVCLNNFRHPCPDRDISRQ